MAPIAINRSVWPARCPRGGLLRVARAVVPLAVVLFVAAGVATATASAQGVSPLLQVAVMASPTAASVGQTISFAAQVANAPPGVRLTYAWSFADGSIGSNRAPRHTYAAAGDYPVAVTVSSSMGTTGAAIVVVHVRDSRRGSCVVPDLRYKSLAAARRALRRSHCTLGTHDRRHASGVPRARVLRQRPPPGSVLARGAPVNVTLSDGR